MAFIYIEHHLDDLKDKKGAQKIHAAMQRATLQESLQEHVQQQLRKYYPVEQYSDEGSMIPELAEMIRKQQEFHVHNHCLRMFHMCKHQKYRRRF